MIISAYYLALTLTESQSVCRTSLSCSAVVVGPALLSGSADSSAALVVARAVVVLGTFGHALLVDAHLVGQAVTDGRAGS